MNAPSNSNENGRHLDEGQRLGEALHGQVDSMTEAPLSFDDVAAKARGLRRNRRIAAGVGIAAAAAVIVPTAVLAGGGGTDRSENPPVASSSPDASSSASPTPTGPVEGDFDVSDLPTGAAPGIAWSDGLTIHDAGGTVTVTGVDAIQELAPMGDGWVVTTNDSEGNLEAVLVGPDGSAGKHYPLEGGLATSPEGEVVAWAGPDGSVTVVQSDGEETFTMPAIEAPGPYSAVAVTSEDCKEGRTTDAGCSVLVNTNGERAKAWVTTSHGIVDQVGGGILATTAYHGFLAGITEVHEDLTTCSELQDQPGVTRWKTCDFRLLGFAPDSEHLVAAGSIGDGFADGELGILDAAGTPLVHLISTQESFTSALNQVWEDDDHVLVVTYADGEWAVVRIGLDGSMEYAVPPDKGSDMDRPFFLQSR
jgi:hypothetical protein